MPDCSYARSDQVRETPEETGDGVREQLRGDRPGAPFAEGADASRGPLEATPAGPGNPEWGKELSQAFLADSRPALSSFSIFIRSVVSAAGGGVTVALEP